MKDFRTVKGDAGGRKEGSKVGGMRADKWKRDGRQGMEGGKGEGDRKRTREEKKGGSVWGRTEVNKARATKGERGADGPRAGR